MTSDYPIEIYLQHHDGCGVYINRKCDCGCAEVTAELAELKAENKQLFDLRRQLETAKTGWKATIDQNAQLRAELDEARKVIVELTHPLDYDPMFAHASAFLERMKETK